MTRHPSGLLAMSREVEQALVRSRAVVALESSLVAHGLPPALGPEVAREAQDRVRERGAVPATVAILDGIVRVGLTDAELDRIANDPEGARKVGPRDLATCVVSGASGATTVAGTIAVCTIAGIHFMATGAIGGAHRGWSSSGDVSADLAEIAHSSVCVVCSGAKSLLDVPATLEHLESLGVPLIGYGTDTFPLFHVRDSPHPVPDRADDAETIAAAVAAHWGFARRGGVVVAQPVAEEHALAPAEVEAAIAAALSEAATRGVAGPALTPAVLTALHAATDGRSLDSNRQLVVDNAGLAAEIAVAYYRP
jgi:pseudouridine-5'-phosphate glycosidase